MYGAAAAAPGREVNMKAIDILLNLQLIVGK